MIINKFFKQTKVFRYPVMVGALTAMVLGCGQQPVANEGQVEFWTMQLQPKFTPYFENVNQTFQGENEEASILWVDVPWDAMESRILTAVSANNAPDVVNLNPDFASQLASRNAWLNLGEEIPEDVRGEYLSKIWEANQIEICATENDCTTSIFGIPWYLTTTVTVYNKDLLQQAGVENPPANFEELAQVAQRVKDETGKYAFFITFVPTDSNEVLNSLVQMGVSLLDGEGKAAFNTPEGERAFSYWVDLYQRDLLPPEVFTQGHRHGVELYQAGESAILGTGAEFLNTIATNAPTVYAQSAVAPQITGETGKRSVSVMNLVIPRSSDNPQKAIDYALFVTNSENQLNFAQEANVLPSHTRAIASYIENLEQESEQNTLLEARKISAMQLDSAEVLIPPSPNINELKKIIYENLQSAMLGEKTVQQALDDAQAQWDNM
ncbi:sugar ABC transporter substrate-binding protein [Cyanobacterium stanieri LEGE 03274]|uniref:Sugar ABC transporter substrate-binding protein n=1 Tax=Cyanobacterium stanieri LEGE 03274 TaxID=1828756 RepID=A0ABR9V192_9CHRO|nr:sugar ABC transporter substrate-binding protein [Cyanobacterium stanieri]MBE9221658.1 sugar ABC transporter substrate-binding protein [Cyanobacterium stanieri LEGE 03274]